MSVYSDNCSSRTALFDFICASRHVRRPRSVLMRLDEIPYVGVTGVVLNLEFSISGPRSISLELERNRTRYILPELLK